MATSRIILNKTEYVRINVGSGQLLIEALAGDVHIVLSDVKPAVTNSAFHKLTDRQRLQFDRLDTNVWALGKNATSQAVVTEFPEQLNALGTGELTLDAWGRQKVINDYSVLHGLFTYNVPNRLWEENAMDAALAYTPLASTGVLATSEDGALKLSSGTTANNGCALMSKRHPRYQPNRGHLYSTAGWFPDPHLDAYRKWGLFCGCLSDARRSGVYFELEGDGASWALYAVVKSYGTVQVKQDITDLIPSGVDISKNNLYDIQYQWRGAGDYFFYINQQLVYRAEFLNTMQELTIWTPALGLGFECFTHTTTPVYMHYGCIDVTSEGGAMDARQFASISTGDTLVGVTTTGTATLGVRLPRTVDYNGNTVVNTRDIMANKLTSWTRDEASVQVWVARDTSATNLAALTWTAFSDVTTEYLPGGTGTALDTAFQADKASMQLVLNEWEDLEQKNVIINPSIMDAPFYLTAGDILVVVVQPLGANKDNATTMYLAEEV